MAVKKTLSHYEDEVPQYEEDMTTVPEVEMLGDEGATYTIYRSIPIGGVTIGDGEYPAQIAALEEVVEALKTEWRNGSLKKHQMSAGVIHDRLVFEIGAAKVKVQLGDFADNAF